MMWGGMVGWGWWWDDELMSCPESGLSKYDENKYIVISLHVQVQWNCACYVNEVPPHNIFFSEGISTKCIDNVSKYWSNQCF